MPKGNTSYKCLSLIMVDSVVKVKKKYYPQTLLEECKNGPKKTKIKSLINDDLEKSLSNEFHIESDDNSNDKIEDEMMMMR